MMWSRKVDTMWLMKSFVNENKLSSSKIQSENIDWKVKKHPIFLDGWSKNKQRFDERKIYEQRDKEKSS